MPTASLGHLLGLEPTSPWPPDPAVPWPAGPPPQPRPALHARMAGPVPVWFLVLPSQPETWLGILEPRASAARRAKAGRCRGPQDALRCLAAEALLGHALAERHGLPPGAWSLASGPLGQPYLPEHPTIQLSLSHSGPWVGCAVHDAPVGLDVEVVSDQDPLPSDALLAPEELAWFRGLAPAQARDAFYRLWTLKESLLKAQGCGLAVDPRELAVDLAGPEIRLLRAPGPVAPWHLLELALPGAAKAALCHRGAKSRRT